MGKLFITGLNGCSCHPFSTWKECIKAHNQRFKIGEPVKDRCNGRTGIVYSIDTLPGYLDVKFGPLPRDINAKHVANLIRI